MSFLRKMFAGGLGTDDPRRFVVEAMLGAMAADGEMDESELEVMQTKFETHELFDGLSSDGLNRLVDMAADSIRAAGGSTARAEAIARGLTSRNHRLAAYALACEVCVADGELPESEIQYLEALQKALVLSDDEAQELFEAARAQSGLLTLEERTHKMRDLLPTFVDCMALMAAADGEIHEAEIVGVKAVLKNIPDMAVLTSEELDDAIDAAFERVEGKDIDAQLIAIADKMTNTADRYWTIVYMMIIALADGKTDWREVNFLTHAEQTFALSDEQMDHAMATAQMFPAVELGGAAPA